MSNQLFESAALRIELAKKKKAKNPRSQFLSMLMGLLSGDQGEAIINAAVSGDGVKFKQHWEKLTTQLVTKVEANKAEE